MDKRNESENALVWTGNRYRKVVLIGTQGLICVLWLYALFRAVNFAYITATMSELQGYSSFNANNDHAFAMALFYTYCICFIASVASLLIYVRWFFYWVALTVTLLQLLGASYVTWLKPEEVIVHFPSIRPLDVVLYYLVTFFILLAAVAIYRRNMIRT